MYYAYARVSTQNQREDRQVIALKNFGVPSRKIMVDKQSGKDFNRKNYQTLLKKLKIGDVLVIKSIDRLGRNYDEILKQWRYITKDIGADIVVLDMELLEYAERRHRLFVCERIDRRCSNRNKLCSIIYNDRIYTAFGRFCILAETCKKIEDLTMICCGKGL